MNAATSPRRRQAARRLARVRSSTSGGVACAGCELTSRRLSRLGLLQLRVDLLVDVGKPAFEVLLRARHVLRDEALEGLLVRCADAGDRRGLRVWVGEDVEEGLEAGERLQEWRLQRVERRRDVL